MNTQTRIAVIGAGIVGCSCALWLQQKGFAVTLIDPEDPGSGTSSGNAGTIADYGCVPVNSPDLFKRLPALLTSKDSPLSLNLGYALSHPSWMIQFLRHCRTDKSITPSASSANCWQRLTRALTRCWTWPTRAT